MTDRDELTRDLAAYLAVDEVRDYGPNGLQVEGKTDISKIALGVTASLAFIEAAIAADADAAIVHHGIFWKGAGEMRVERSLRGRLSRLLAANVTLLAYHLPLDRHPEVGNNAVLARFLGAVDPSPAFPHEGVPIGLIARFGEPLAAAAAFARIESVVGRTPLIIDSGPELVRSIGLVTGAAPRYLEEAARLGVDLFLTGEPSEPVVHLAREERIHFVAAGHHATERFGVRALGEYLAQRFAVETAYIEVDNPV